MRVSKTETGSRNMIARYLNFKAFKKDIPILRQLIANDFNFSAKYFHSKIFKFVVFSS